MECITLKTKGVDLGLIERRGCLTVLLFYQGIIKEYQKVASFFHADLDQSCVNDDHRGGGSGQKPRESKLRSVASAPRGPLMYLQ